MDDWTRCGFTVSSPPPVDPRTRVERSIFLAYRALLDENGWQDSEGFALWAASELADSGPDAPWLTSPVFIVDGVESKAVNLAIEALHHFGQDLTVLRVGDAQGSRFRQLEDPREAFLGLGFEESPMPTAAECAPGMAYLAQNLFLGEGPPTSDLSEGLSILGGGEPDGQPLCVARRVRDLLDRGVPCDEILVITPQPDDLRARVVENLNAWGIRAFDPEPRKFAFDPAIAALRLAMNLPLEGWDADRLVALLRNGQIRPDWPEMRTPRALAVTAQAVRESRVHRDFVAIRKQLVQISSTRRDDVPQGRTSQGRSQRAKVAVGIFDRLMTVYEGLTRPGTWDDLVGWLFELSHELGIAPTPALGHLRTALEDQGEVFRRLGQDFDAWSWGDFVGDVEAVIRALTFPTPQRLDPGVRVLGPESVPGLAYRHVILAGLGEGTFPSRRAMDTARSDPASLDRAFETEKARFLGLVAMASEGLTLVYPTRDEKGHELLAASFLEDVQRLFTDAAWSRARVTLPRLGAILPEDLAIAPNEARVHAVARSCLHRENDALDRLLARPEHREPLSGAAHALRLAHWRSRRNRFDRYDGRLRDPRIVARLGEMIGTQDHPFSASHLESMAICPFQFFQKFILRLPPNEERPEIDEDPAARGSLLHRALEDLHARLRDMPDDQGRPLPERVEAGILPTLENLLESQSDPGSDVDQGLFLIESGRLRRLARRYARQFRKYAEGDGRDALGRFFEVAFGRPDDPYPPLQIGRAPGMIAVSGVIDRIDFVQRDGQAYFRVIDYKSGAAIPTRDIDQGLALQLPLYAMAAERMMFADEQARALDFAYWSIRDRGFSRAKSMDAAVRDGASWKAFTTALEGYLGDLVDRVHAGDLPLSPRKRDCRSHCDYQFICRISHTGAAPKPWAEQPSLEVPS